MRDKPVADYTPCEQCGHPNTFHCLTRGCRAITYPGERGQSNLLCGYGPGVCGL